MTCWMTPPGGIEACIIFATQQGHKLELKVEGSATHGMLPRQSSTW